MEQIYMIPVTEAFEASLGSGDCGCPLCRLYKKLEEDELDIILGASMMEPDIRIKTNEQGFCLTHYNMMLPRRRMLGMALMMESHLTEVDKLLRGPAVLGDRKASSLASLSKLEGSCYVCGRVDRNISAMISTVVHLWESDYNGFRKTFSGQPWFCLVHYRAMLDYASRKLNKKIYKDFFDECYRIEKSYLDTLRADVTCFCRSFDYSYDKEVDGVGRNPKDSVKRSIRFLSGCFDEEAENKR